MSEPSEERKAGGSESAPTDEGRDFGDDLEEFRKRVKNTRKEYEDITAEEREKITINDDRSLIGKMIIQLFCFSVLGIFGLIYLGIISKTSGSEADWEKPATQFINFVQVAVVPIVTLVLGFYFGRADKSKNAKETS